MEKTQEVNLEISLTGNILIIAHASLEAALDEMRSIASAIEDASVYLSADKYVCVPAGQIVCARVYLTPKAKE